MNLGSFLPKRAPAPEDPPPFVFFPKPGVRQSLPPRPTLLTIEERRSAVEDLARLRAEHAAVNERYAAEIASAEGEVARLEALHGDAKARAATLRVEAMTASVTYDNTEARLLMRLRMNPLIDRFQSEIIEQMEAARAPGVVRTVERPAREVAGEQVRTRFESNGASVRRRLEALGRAYQTAEALRTVLLTEEELRTRLIAERKQIPPIEELLISPAPLVTAGEARESAWRRGESA